MDHFWAIELNGKELLVYKNKQGKIHKLRVPRNKVGNIKNIDDSIWHSYESIFHIWAGLAVRKLLKFRKSCGIENDKSCVKLREIEKVAESCGKWQKLQHRDYRN